MTTEPVEQLVPDEVIPHQTLPPLRYRDMPEAIPWTRMVGPSIILAGMALGSGEFIIWPQIVYHSGYVFFWACLLGVVTQFFLNMEIERWALVTGETATTGFCRMSLHWAWVMLILNIVPWAWPGWATGAGQMLSWLVMGPIETQTEQGMTYGAHYVTTFGIGGLVLIGIVLTAGPVVYNTVERIQTVLVFLILLIVVVLSFLIVRVDAVLEMLKGSLLIGQMPDLANSDLTYMTLLGALAFAGAGGTLNLCQSAYIKDKGYGMGKYIGRITSPITGAEEAVEEIGYHFQHTPENLARWRRWWKAANTEHLFSFLLTCVACLVLMTLISYCLLHDTDGKLKPGMEHLGGNMDFVWGQAIEIEKQFGSSLKAMFLVMGVIIMMTTELGVLDAVSRISADIVKTNYLRENANWSASRLYFFFLWGEILLGSIILLLSAVVDEFEKPLFLIKTAAAMNAGVMFIYSLLLLYMNSKILSRSIAITPFRFLMLVWSCGFFGFFSIIALQQEVFPYLQEAFGYVAR